MSTNDFTSLPLGTKLDNDEIQVCPHCGSRAKLEVVQDASYYVHSETLASDRQSPLVTSDMCPKKSETAFTPAIN